MYTVLQRSADQHSNWPAEFNRADVIANPSTVVRLKRQEPFADRFASRLGPKEDYRNAFSGGFCHQK